MGRFLGFIHNHCFIALFLTSLSPLSLAQYEHWPYLPGYPEPPPQVYQPPQRPANVPKIQLRLAGQKRKHNEGRVEVFYSGEWGTVCDDDFSIHAAHVVCRELGYVEAVSWLPSSKYGKGEGKDVPGKQRLDVCNSQEFLGSPSGLRCSDAPTSIPKAAPSATVLFRQAKHLVPQSRGIACWLLNPAM